MMSSEQTDSDILRTCG